MFLAQKTKAIAPFFVTVTSNQTVNIHFYFNESHKKLLKCRKQNYYIKNITTYPYTMKTCICYTSTVQSLLKKKKVFKQFVRFTFCHIYKHYEKHHFFPSTETQFVL